MMRNPDRAIRKRMQSIASRRNESLKEGKRWRVIDTVISFVAVVVFVLAIRATVLEPVRVDGSSMLDTMQHNNYLFVEKLSYAFGTPKAGDIIICYYPDAYYTADGQNKAYRTRVKRVVAVAGDTVETRDGVLYVNGVAMEEPYLSEERGRTTGIETPITIPEGTVYVLGDNRVNSNDSRKSLVGPIPLEKIVGKAHFVLFPLTELKKL